MASLKSKPISSIVIDLGEDINIKQTTLVLLEQGKELAFKYRLETASDDSTSALSHDKPITILVPHHVYGITSTFFQGMFGKLMNHLGSTDAFRKRVSFELDNDSLRVFVETNIDEVWNRMHPQFESTYDPETDF